MALLVKSLAKSLATVFVADIVAPCALFAAYSGTQRVIVVTFPELEYRSKPQDKSQDEKTKTPKNKNSDLSAFAAVYLLGGSFAGVKMFHGLMPETSTSLGYYLCRAHRGMYVIGGSLVAAKIINQAWNNLKKRDVF